jgi:hypothetical protein
MPSYPLRFPDPLNDLARQRAASMGLSLNAFICMAVEAYLQRPNAGVGAGAFVAAEADCGHGVAVERPFPRWATEDPKPVLGPRATKRQRRALAEWHERERLRTGEFAIPDID